MKVSHFNERGKWQHYLTHLSLLVIQQQKVQNQTDEQWEIYQLILSITLMLVVLTTVIILWKIKYDISCQRISTFKHASCIQISFLFPSQNIYLHVAKHPTPKKHPSADLQAK